VRRYRLRVPAAEAEPALVRMLDLFPGGVEEERDGDDVILAGYADEAPADGLEPEDVEPGWEDRWRAYHRPVTVGRIWVGPPWAGDRPDADSRLVVVIDPGRAFGTGGHGSTRAALELLQRLHPCPALDLGCGSGVLSIAAVKLGFGPAVAIDNDPLAVEATRSNAAANGVDVDARLVDASVCSLPPSDVAVANVALGPVEAVASRLDASTLLSSGYLHRDEPRLPGWRRAERRVAGEWAADRFERE
jgi:ribosomal protein L11 methyltransferase